MNTILVTAATGNVGSALVPRLRAQGANVRVLVRDRGRAADLAAAGAQLAVGDLADRSSLRSALDGVECLFLACSNRPDQVDLECSLIDEAARAGVRRIVKLSARGAAVGSPVTYWHWHGLIEQHLTSSGVAAVVLQPGFLMTNLLAATDQVRAAGRLFAPAGDAAIAMIHPSDVAAAAAAVLTEDGHEGQSHILTGPAAVTYTQVAEALSRTTGRFVGYVDIPPQAALAALAEAGLPLPVAEQVVAVFQALRDGSQARTTADVRQLTGREPQPLETFACEVADLFQPDTARTA